MATGGTNASGSERDSAGAANLCVVLIARNEEDGIATCIESVLRNVEKVTTQGLIGQSDVVLVDSASTDQTVAIALRYPVRVLRLAESWPRSAAAGRYTGFRLTSAPLVFFLDGDEELVEGWLEKGLALLREPGVGAVAGQEAEITEGPTVLAQRYRSALRSENKPKDAAEVDSMSSGLFRREAIESVGGIQPFLKAAEDRDLGTRLRQAGWRLLRTPDTMAKHRFSGTSPLTYVDYFRSVARWSLGEGQVFRYRFRQAYFRRYYFTRYGNVRFAIGHWYGLLLAILGLVNLLAVTSQYWIPASFLDVVAILTLDAVRRSHGWTWRELVYELHGIPYTIIRHGGFLMGTMIRTPDASLYPLTPESVTGSAARVR